MFLCFFNKVQLETAEIIATSQIGHLTISFSHKSERSKRRKPEKIRADVPCEELAYATQMSLRALGK